MESMHFPGLPEGCVNLDCGTRSQGGIVRS